MEALLRSNSPRLRGRLLHRHLAGRRAYHLDFVSYAVEKRLSKHPEAFGKGCIEGVAGPESANNAATGMHLRHFPTTGGGPIMMAILGKQVEISHCVVPVVCAPQVEAGKIRLLAMTSEERHPAYPDVPTLRELGYEVTHAIWHAVMVPAGTPPEIVATLRRGLKAMVDDEAVKASLQKLGERPQYLNSEAFSQFLEQDYQKVGATLRQIIKP